MLDVNYMLRRQQISVFRASRAASCESRTAHEGLAKAYSEKIIAYRERNRNSANLAAGV